MTETRSSKDLQRRKLLSFFCLRSRDLCTVCEQQRALSEALFQDERSCALCLKLYRDKKLLVFQSNLEKLLFVGSY